MRGRKPGSPKVKDLGAGRFKVVDGGVDETVSPAPAADDHAPPDWITSEDARALWRQLVLQLLARRQYIPLFEAELGRYCVAFGHYVEALRVMDEKGGAIVLSRKNNQVRAVAFDVAQSAHKTMLALAADLGLNPVAQVRLAGLQLDLFDKPSPRTGTGGAADSGTGFGQFRRH